MRLWLKRSLFAAVLLLIASQLVRPQKTNPTVNPAQTIQADLPVSTEVRTILERSCSDCHSDHTTWPWYTNVAPSSWLVINHVNEGRQKLNLSRWASYPNEKKSKLLEKMCKEVSDGGMPLTSYLLIHWGARLRQGDAQAICAWTEAAQKLPAGAPGNAPLVR